jgi:NAD(P)-dependent dehydrogenase (short-subunit alcohol dehydrogenase family)
MELGLRGRTAAITGASKGIGLGIAKILAAEGVNIVMLSRGEADLSAAADGVRAAHNVAVRAIPTDVTDTASVRAAAAAVRDDPAFGTVHILVNNAGSAIRRTDRQITWDDGDWEHDIQVKTVGALRMVREFLPLMPTDGTGRVVQITGVAGMTTWTPALTHGINNSGLNHMVGYLAADLAKENITVNAVVPGLISTEWRETWADAMAAKDGITREAFLERYCKAQGIVVGRWASVEEVGDVVAFVASDRARYLTGTKIPVDGGITINPR